MARRPTPAQGISPQQRGADAGDDDAAAFALSSVMDSGEKNRSVMHSILKSPFRPKAPEIHRRPAFDLHRLEVSPF
jgi:hypothetical protein